ncbi:hypothetical protein GCM10010289_50020 [Streptomyces violascens]|uniref:Uncharacterized protein n=1 Tax=Streptomyces violascens TaxID=67381 RepID=A0ABQ3QYK9_9ACTN|nr:hypothetical protein GCM10010289_50020 [Streptomyces violascens]GHI42333.1 hypothetical protein Sviol_67410 [Streptomyces violascens]
MINRGNRGALENCAASRLSIPQSGLRQTSSLSPRAGVVVIIVVITTCLCTGSMHDSASALQQLVSAALSGGVTVHCYSARRLPVRRVFVRGV